MQELIELRNFLNQNNVDDDKLSSTDLFKLKFCQNLVTIFLNYHIKTVSFDFKEIYRISTVWEGSAEDLFILEMNREYSSFAYSKIYATITNKFDYLTEEPNHIKLFLKSSSLYQFEFSNTTSLTEQIDDFLGETKSYLVYKYLDKQIDSKLNDKTTKRVKL